MSEPRSELERIVARLLPGIVAEQLAAMHPSPVRDAVPGEPDFKAAPRDRVPEWYRNAGAALADYANELALAAFDPEGREATSDMRRLHWTAVDARDRAAGILADAGRGRDKSKDVYAAIGRGREALIRLRAARLKHPVPLQLLTPEELSGAPRAQSPHTGERFHWQGDLNTEILLDRPVPDRPALFEAAATNGALMTHMRRTAEVVSQVRQHFVDADLPVVEVIAPTVTHVKFSGTWQGKWSLRLIDPERLPVLGESARGTGHMLFLHTRGSAKVVLQSLRAVGLTLYPPSLERQEIADHPGETRTTVLLPKTRGVLHISTNDRWSIDPAA